MLINNWHRIELTLEQVNCGLLDKMISMFKESNFLNTHKTAVFRDINISDRFVLYFPPNVWHYCYTTLKNVPEVKCVFPAGINLEIYQGASDAIDLL